MSRLGFIGIYNRDRILALRDVKSNHYYVNPETNERVLATYKVVFLERTVRGSEKYIEANSSLEALQIASKMHITADDFEDSDYELSLVIDEEVECEEPPEGAISVQGSASSKASVADAFEDG